MSEYFFKVVDCHFGVHRVEHKIVYVHRFKGGLLVDFAALTEKACKAIKIEREVGLSFFEKKILRKASEQNRKKGIELATEICKQHRREGKFFDEILTEALNGEKT